MRPRTPASLAPRVMALAVACVAILAAAPSAQAFCFGFLHVHVTQDLNGNGVEDPGEPALQGIAVQLDQGADGTVEQTLTTDANGDVDFYAPAVVVYRVRVVTPTGSMQTTANPSDLHLVCNGSTNVSFAIVQTVPALSGGLLALLALSLAGIALVVVRR